MSKIRGFFQRYLVQIVALMIPIISFFLYYLKFREGDGGIFLPASPWNDELLYYKQVKDIIFFGGPKGFYGYNESNALIGGLGAWSPAVFAPFIVFGKIFGWRFNSSIIYNLIFWIFGFEFYVCVLKPSLKKLLWFGLLWASVGQTLRFIYSLMPESFIAVLLFVFSVTIIKYSYDDGRKYLIIANICMIMLTLMRGYYALFGIVIAIILIIKKKKLYLPVIQVCISILAAGGFLILLKLFTAPYFEALLDLTWLTELLSNPLVGILHIKDIIYSAAVDISQYVWLGVAGGDMVGALYCLYYMLLTWSFAKCTIGKEKKAVLPCLVLACILIALWLLYAPYQSGRHLLSFCALGMFLLTEMEDSRIVKLLFALVACVMMWNSKEAYNSYLPEASKEFIVTLENASKTLPEILVLSEEDPWDNTVLWTGGHGYLYAIPEGFGINCCRVSYIQENANNLKSRYLATDVDSEVDLLAQEQPWEKIAEYGNKRIYKLR